MLVLSLYGKLNEERRGILEEFLRQRQGLSGMNDVVVNKVQSIQRRVLRAREEYRAAGGRFLEDYTHQDAAILNITRACEQAIHPAGEARHTYGQRGELRATGQGRHHARGAGRQAEADGRIP